MPFHFVKCDAAPTTSELRQRALLSAMVLRDCSLRVPMSRIEHRACRSLMRERAIRWRHPALL